MDITNREDNQNARDAMEKLGIEFVHPDESEIAHWKKLAIEVIDEFGEKAISPELYKKVTGMLAEYRSRKGSMPSK